MVNGTAPEEYYLPKRNVFWQKFTHISEERVASIFRAEDKQAFAKNQAGILLVFFVDLNDGGSIFLRNVGTFILDYMASQKRVLS
jgi:hypothetical protein